MKKITLITLLMISMVSTAPAGFSFMGDMIKDMNDAAKDMKGDVTDSAREIKDEMSDATTEMVDSAKDMKPNTFLTTTESNLSEETNTTAE